MTVLELSKFTGLKIVCGDGERDISSGIYCCDLLSVVMAKAPADSIWITVMGNINAAAVASLANTACIIVAHGMQVDSDCISAAEKNGITILSTELPVYEASVLCAGAIGV